MASAARSIFFMIEQLGRSPGLYRAMLVWKLKKCFFVAMGLAVFLGIFSWSLERTFQAGAVIEFMPTLSWVERLGGDAPPPKFDAERALIVAHKTLSDAVRESGSFMSVKPIQTTSRACESLRAGLVFDEQWYPDRLKVSFCDPDPSRARKTLEIIMDSYQLQRRVRERRRADEAHAVLKASLREQAVLVGQLALRKRALEKHESLEFESRLAEFRELSGRKTLKEMQVTYATDLLEKAEPDMPIVVEYEDGQWQTRMSASSWGLMFCLGGFVAGATFWNASLLGALGLRRAVVSGEGSPEPRT